MDLAVTLKQGVEYASRLARMLLLDCDERCAESALSLQWMPAVGHTAQRSNTSNSGLLVTTAGTRQVPGAARRPTATLHAHKNSLSFSVLCGSECVPMRIGHNRSESEVGARALLGSFAVNALK